MNAIRDDRIFMRSMATRSASGEIPRALSGALLAVKAAGFDLILVETAGIGQGNSGIVALTDLSIYVMTREYGAESQLEKIDMLDQADLVAVNKFDKQGSEDALSQVRRQVRFNRNAQDQPLAQMPVYGTIAAKFNDSGVTALYHAMLDALRKKTGRDFQSQPPAGQGPDTVAGVPVIIIPPERVRYLSEIADALRQYHRHTQKPGGSLARGVASGTGNGHPERY